MWNEGGVEVVAATEVGGVSFCDDEAVLGGSEDFGFKIIDEKTFKGSHSGTPDRDVHVIGVQGNACCTTGLVCPDKARPVGIDTQNALCSGFFDRPQCEFPKNVCEGEAEVAFPSPDVGDFGEEELGDGGFVDFDAWGDGGCCRTGCLAVLFGDNGDAFRVELGDEVAEDGGGPADVGWEVGGDDHHFPVLGSCWHLSWISLAKEKRDGGGFFFSSAGIPVLFFFFNDSLVHRRKPKKK